MWPAKFMVGIRTSRGLAQDEFWTNQVFSFDLRRVESGLLGKMEAGKNNSGLQMLNGLIRPDTETSDKWAGGSMDCLGAGIQPDPHWQKENSYWLIRSLGLGKKKIEATV